MIQIFLADGRDGRDQPKVVQEVLADLKKKIIPLTFYLDDDCFIISDWQKLVSAGTLATVVASYERVVSHW